MNCRYFMLENQWNVIHLPEKPNGFGILILGDSNHFVEGSTSLWTQHKGRERLVDCLLEKGYTVFYSNLFGANWGSIKAFRLARQLYHLVMRQEILNRKIHLLAEGMGGLLALQLMEEMSEEIRSAAFLNPCLDFELYYKQAQKHPFFLKRLEKEYREAHNLTRSTTREAMGNHVRLEYYQNEVPAKIWADVRNSSPYSVEHSKQYEKLKGEQGGNVEISFYLPEKQYLFSKALCSFYKSWEQEL